jgi:hypothetical protein
MSYNTVTNPAKLGKGEGSTNGKSDLDPDTSGPAAAPHELERGGAKEVFSMNGADWKF